MIFMTSNLGGEEMTELITGGMGFAPTVPADAKPRLDEKLEKTASEVAKRKFAPEFINRIDKITVFHPLRQEQLEQILEIELARVQQRVMDAASRRFRFRVTPAAQKFLLCEGTDLKYGAPAFEKGKRMLDRKSTGTLGSERSSEHRRHAFDRSPSRRQRLGFFAGQATIPESCRDAARCFQFESRSLYGS
jgi:hypothetical protein